jgi:hypothetical protein
MCDVGYVQYASLCNYQAFQADISSVIATLHPHHYEELRSRAIRAINALNLRYDNFAHLSAEELYTSKYARQGWTFLKYGHGRLPSIEGIQTIKSPTAYDIGNWLLFVLAEYTYSLTDEPKGWGVLAGALKLIEPNNRGSLMLSEGIGQPLYTMLGYSEGSCPDFIHFKPGHTNIIGWLTKEDVAYLHDILVRRYIDIVNVNVRLLPYHYDRDDPLLITYYRDAVRTGYWSAISTLEAAMKTDLGIITGLSVQ